MGEDESAGPEIEALLHALDNHPRRATAEEVMARAGRSRRAPWRIAASVAAALAVAGVAWALPGSPLPAWLHSVAGSAEGSAPPPGPAPGRGSEAGGGVVLDASRPLEVRVTAGSTGYVRITLGDDDGLTVRTLAGAPAFTSEPDRLDVTLGPADSVALHVPTSAVAVVVRASGREVFSRLGDALVTSLPRDSAGAWELRPPLDR